MSVAKTLEPPRTTRRSLSQPRKNLLRIMQEINYGRIVNLHFRDGEPVFSQTTRIERHVKFGADNSARREADLVDFDLKAKYIELFSYMDRLRHGEIRLLDIKGGLPFAMTIEDRTI